MSHITNSNFSKENLLLLEWRKNKWHKLFVYKRETATQIIIQLKLRKECEIPIASCQNFRCGLCLSAFSENTVPDCQRHQNPHQLYTEHRKRKSIAYVQSYITVVLVSINYVAKRKWGRGERKWRWERKRSRERRREWWL